MFSKQLKKVLIINNTVEAKNLLDQLKISIDKAGREAVGIILKSITRIIESISILFGRQLIEKNI